MKSISIFWTTVLVPVPTAKLGLDDIHIGSA